MAGEATGAVRHSGSAVRGTPRSAPAALLALLLTLALTASACAGTGEGPRGPTSTAPVGTTGTAREAGHAALGAIATLAELPRADVRLTRDDSDDVHVLAAVAADDASRTRGLQGVTDLPEGVGMLFLFPESAGPGGRPGFWMRDTLVPLDIVFAVLTASDGAAGGSAAGAADDAPGEGGGSAIVVGIAAMVPCRAMPCPITHPGVDYDLALEVAAGWLAATGVAPGDVLTWVAAVRPR
jgi:uncharacterized membrane protein (UPF0127 family)